MGEPQGENRRASPGDPVASRMGGRVGLRRVRGLMAPHGGAYFAWIVCRYRVRTSTLYILSHGSLRLILAKVEPQTGIPFAVCAGISVPYSSTLTTCSFGKFPLFFLLSAVRSAAAGVVNLAGTGSPPLPSAPWHDVQYLA